jgi:hypothetical protein
MFAGPPDGAVDRSDAPSGNFRGDSTASYGCVDPCPHDVHRDAWTPLRERGRIVDMTALLGVFAAGRSRFRPRSIETTLRSCPRARRLSAPRYALYSMWGG